MDSIGYLRRLRLFSHDVRLYLIATATMAFAILGIYGVLFNLYLLRLGYGPEFVGLVSAAGQLGFSASCLLVGALGTRWRTRRMMIAGIGLIVVGFGSLPLTEFMPLSWQEGWLVATYALARVGAALYLVNGTLFLTGATSPEERVYAFSVLVALQRLLGFAGSLVGGLLPGFFAGVLGVAADRPAPYRYSLLTAALLPISAVLALLATREVRVRRKKWPVVDTGTAPLGLIALLALIVLFRCAGRGAVTIFFNVYLDAGLHVSTSRIGALNAAAQLVAVPASLVMPLLVARWGKARCLILVTLCTAVSLLPLAAIPHWVAAGFSFVGMMMLFSITSPAMSVYSQESVLPDWQAAVAGAVNMAAGLGPAIAAMGGGYAIGALGYRSVFWAGAGLTATGALLLWACSRVLHGEPRPDKAKASIFPGT